MGHHALVGLVGMSFFLCRWGADDVQADRYGSRSQRSVDERMHEAPRVDHHGGFQRYCCSGIHQHGCDLCGVVLLGSCQSTCVCAVHKAMFERGGNPPSTQPPVSCPPHEQVRCSGGLIALSGCSFIGVLGPPSSEPCADPAPPRHYYWPAAGCSRWPSGISAHSWTLAIPVRFSSPARIVSHVRAVGAHATWPAPLVERYPKQVTSTCSKHSVICCLTSIWMARAR